MKTSYGPTWAEVNLDAIRHNLKQVRRLAGADVGIMVIVKGNAYGHGMVNVSRFLSSLGVEYLGVATMDEALLLRKKKISTPILVLGSILPGEINVALKNNITLTLADKDILKAMDKKARRLGLRGRGHIKIDTGMGRIGLWHEDEAIDFLETILSSSSVDIEGIYTHFSAAARDRVYTEYQISSFEQFIGQLLNRGLNIPYRHAANSIASVNLKRSHLNLIRPGLIIYGMYPKRGFKRHINLKPALSLKTKIVYLKKVPPGRSISYGRTYITQAHTKIATLPIGYADGYGRILSNKAEVLVRGERAPVIGKVTMDQTMINVGHIKNVRVGDEVVLIGTQKANEITVERLARLAGTIPYEIVCSLTDRVPRIYRR